MYLRHCLNNSLVKKKLLHLNYNENTGENKVFDTWKPVFKWSAQLGSWMSSEYLPECMEERREWRLGGKKLRKARKEEARERKRPLTDSIVLFPRMIQYLKKISLQKCTEYSWTIFALDLKLITSFPNCKSIHFNPLFPSFSSSGAARAGIWAIEGGEGPLVHYV